MVRGQKAMINYLVIAQSFNDMGIKKWDACLYKRQNNPSLFDYLLKIAENETKITLDNYDNVDKGVILAESIDNNTESVMRVLGFRKCDKCFEWVTPQDIRNRVSTYSNGIRLCEKCKLLAEQELLINPHIRLEVYHSTNGQVRVINGVGENFDLSNVLGIGIEMEFKSTNGYYSSIKCTQAFYQLANPNSRNRVFRCEEDGTVDGEIISNVFTKKALYAFDWNVLTDQLKLIGNDEARTQVGFHVHLSKLWLGTQEKEQALNFLKLQYFLKCYENDFLLISKRRREGSDMEYCQFYSTTTIEDMKVKIKRNISLGQSAWYGMPTSHGYALISSGATIELRIGKSTNDPERIKHYLYLILGIVENIKNVPFEKCYCIGKVTRLVPTETMNYWRKQGAFLTTKAINERGVTL